MIIQIKVPYAKATIQKVLDFVKLNEFKEVKTAVVTTNDLAAALTGNEKNY